METVTKQEFVANQLAATVKAAYAGVESLAYDESSEIVTVTFDNGYTKRVNVALDSLAGIMHDVCKALG